MDGGGDPVVLVCASFCKTIFVVGRSFYWLVEKWDGVVVFVWAVLDAGWSVGSVGCFAGVRFVDVSVVDFGGHSAY